MMTGIEEYYEANKEMIADFIAEKCVVSPALTIKKSDLYDMYLAYCRANKHTPLTKRTFGTLMAEMRHKSTRGAKGVRLWARLGVLK